MRAYSSFQSAFYFFLLCPDLSSWAINVEPPFASKTLEEIHKLNNLPSLIDPNQLIRGIDPAVFKALLDTNGNTKNSQPNPIARSFPQSATGTINSTTAVIPIDFAVARTIIPKQYAILKNSIYQTLPCFPKDKYPLIISTQIDHDVGAAGLKLQDFSSVGFKFPFVDLLGDGYSSFAYVPVSYLSDNAVAIAGTKAYGQGAIVATFQPPKDPYAFVPPSKATKAGEYFFKVFKGSVPVLKATYAPQPGEAGQIGAYPLSFYTNVTNQPTFGCDSPTCLLTCDNMIRFFRTRITTGQFEPVGVTGHVYLAESSVSGIDIFPQGLDFRGVNGVKLDTAFLENNYKNCSDLKGYTYQNV